MYFVDYLHFHIEIRCKFGDLNVEVFSFSRKLLQILENCLVNKTKSAFITSNGLQLISVIWSDNEHYLLFLFVIAVFCLYKSLVNDELIYNFDSNKYSSLISSKQQQNALPNAHEVDGELTSSYNELNDARQQLRLLEMKIKTLENRIAKKYPDVSFLNYKNRKRILVSKRPLII